MRFPRLVFMIVLFVSAAGLGASARGQAPGGGPHGGPPPGSPGSTGMGGPGGPPSTGSSTSAATAHTTNGAAHSSVQFGPVGRWWDDKSVVKSVGLSQDQQKKMDGIFDANKSAIKDSYTTFLAEKAKLEKINKDPHSDQATVFAAIDAVNKAHAALEKATAQMFLQIKQQMAPAQISKLEKLQ
jgi:Spy/CpxP family protein refolding chaperone